MVTKKKQPVAAKLAEAFQSTPPTHPALSSSDKTYLKGLTKRGYTEDEIIDIAKKAGFLVPTDLFVTKQKIAKEEHKTAG